MRLQLCKRVQGEIVGYMDLRGALRFSTKQEAADALRRLPEPVRHKHIVAEVPVLQLLYFPPYGTRMDEIGRASCRERV